MKYLKNFQSTNESYDKIAAICDRYNIQNWTLNEDGSIDVDDSVSLRDFKLTKLPLKFRNVTGWFNCSRNNLTSLDGSPQSVGGNFYCQDNQIRDFEGIGIIDGFFSCTGCPIYNIWELFRNKYHIELLNDYDAIRDDKIILNRLNDFLEVVGRPTVTEVEGYKCI